MKLDFIDKIAIIRMDRLAHLNTINDKYIEELEHVISFISKKSQIHAAVITGTGNTFAAGADLKYFQNSSSQENINLNRKLIATFNRIEQSSIPYIASINGIAFGGGLELALACSIRIASDRAVVGLPEVKLGILPGAGGTQRLPRLISKGKALYYLLTGDSISASEAESIGLFDRVVHHDELERKTFELAQKISENAPLAVKAICQSVEVGLQMPLEKAIQYTEEQLLSLANSSDCREGIDAFLNKRKPHFTGI
ncbi:enoyl-CoA hydratase/isomerase family protein [Neobacillus sp.]|uniref:enoyl-CoA hydratase/isomerase family protein n=1 Tax=Neobacillus sp. TaxID=2675273 RepID=UPI00289A6FA2|nr:enoyl-CoA hydratase/isomerase family protein [Neobacillus sp.]